MCLQSVLRLALPHRAALPHRCSVKLSFVSTYWLLMTSCAAFRCKGVDFCCLIGFAAKLGVLV